MYVSVSVCVIDVRVGTDACFRPILPVVLTLYGMCAFAQGNSSSWRAAFCNSGIFVFGLEHPVHRTPHSVQFYTIIYQTTIMNCGFEFRAVGGLNSSTSKHFHRLAFVKLNMHGYSSGFGLDIF
mgnify:CR=1 FL=1